MAHTFTDAHLQLSGYPLGGSGIAPPSNPTPPFPSIAWHVPATPPAGADSFYDVAWSPTLGFVVTGFVGTDAHIWTSPDGETWTDRFTLALGPGFYITWAPVNALWVAVGATTCLTSPDGIAWTTHAIAFTTNAWGINETASGALVASGTGFMFRSVNAGVTWTPISIAPFFGEGPVASHLARVISPSGQGPTEGTQISTNDGVAWALTAEAYAANLISCAYQSRRGLFYTSGYLADSSGGVIRSSVDGTAWVNYESPGGSDALFYAQVVDVTGIPLPYLLCVGDFNTTANVTVASYDGGTEWSSGAAPLGIGAGWGALAYDTTNKRLLIVGLNGDIAVGVP